MSCSPLVSDMVAKIRNALKPHVHDGHYLSPDEICALVRNLNSVHALAIEMEDDFSILQRQVRRNTQSPVTAIPDLGPNIVRFPLKTRIAIVRPEGGDAA